MAWKENCVSIGVRNTENTCIDVMTAMTWPKLFKWHLLQNKRTRISLHALCNLGLTQKLIDYKNSCICENNVAKKANWCLQVNSHSATLIFKSDQLQDKICSTQYVKRQLKLALILYKTILTFYDPLGDRGKSTFENLWEKGEVCYQFFSHSEQFCLLFPKWIFSVWITCNMTS